MTSVFQDKLMIGLAMALYMSVIIGIGLYYAMPTIRVQMNIF